MENIKALYLMTMLYKSEVTDRDKVLKKIVDSIKMTKEYKQLFDDANQSYFIGRDGFRIREEVELILSEILTDVDRLVELANRMDIVKTNLYDEANRSKERLESPGFFLNDLKVVNDSDKDVYSQFYYELSNAILYLLISKYGIDWLNDIQLNDKGSFSDLLDFVNVTLKDVIQLSNKWQSISTWRVSPFNHYGWNIYSYSGYKLDYHSDLESAMANIDAIDIAEVTPYLYVVKRSDGNYEYVGQGHVVGFGVMETIHAIESGVLYGMNEANLGDLRLSLSNPMKLLQDVYGSRNFCVKANEFVNILDEAARSYTIKTRKENGMCIMCGKFLEDGSIACQTHIPLRG